MSSETQLTDARAMRAVAHPTRLALLGLLRRDGPLTATQAGARLGESSGSASFHLRQLAKHGFVEEAGGGRGRERPWRATARGFSWETVHADPEVAAAAEHLTAVVLERLFAKAAAWVRRTASDPPEWQRAPYLGDALLYLTPDELAQLAKDIQTLGADKDARTNDASLRPDGARPVSLVTLAFPIE